MITSCWAGRWEQDMPIRLLQSYSMCFRLNSQSKGKRQKWEEEEPLNTSGIRSRAAHLAFRSTSGLQHCTHRAAFSTALDPHPAPKDSISWALPPPNHSWAVLQSKQDSYSFGTELFPLSLMCLFPWEMLLREILQENGNKANHSPRQTDGIPQTEHDTAETLWWEKRATEKGKGTEIVLHLVTVILVQWS